MSEPGQPGQPHTPQVEARRKREFSAELLERARAWIPTWELDADAAGGAPDFGRALLEIAARFDSEVAERLDRSAEKNTRGFLDWLGIKGAAARAARMPVVLQLTENTPNPVLARAPVKLQADADGAAVVFETETDVQLVPGLLQTVVAVDPADDAFYLPPPGIASVEPAEPLPTQWRLKSFTASGSTQLQLDPELGLVPEMLVEVAGQQYRLLDVKQDIVTIDPALAAGEGLAAQSLVAKVSSFAPFDGHARNRQEHALYIGDDELLNIEAAALIEVAGAQDFPAGVQWQYWGKSGDGDEAGWQVLSREQSQAGDAIALRKPKGAIDPHPVGHAESRWIRAVLAKAEGRPVTVDALTLRINCGAQEEGQESPQERAGVFDAGDGAAAPPLDGVSNTTPLVLDQVFYPFGHEPRVLDTFYLGCVEAFSKPSAQVRMGFEMADATIAALAALRISIKSDPGPITVADAREANQQDILAGVGRDACLHLLAFDPASGAVSRYREPLQPPQPAFGSTESGAVRLPLDSEPPWRPAVWTDNRGDFFVAVTAGADVGLWHGGFSDPAKSGWEAFGSIAPETGKEARVEGMVYLSGLGKNLSILFALRGKKLFSRAVEIESPWTPVNTGLTLALIAPVQSVTSRDGAGTVDDGLIAVSTDGEVYLLSSSGQATKLRAGFSRTVRPFALRSAEPSPSPSATQTDGTGNAARLMLVGVDPAGAKLLAFLLRLDAQTGAWSTDQEDSFTLEGGATVFGGDLGADLVGNGPPILAATDSRESGRQVLGWEPFKTGVTTFPIPEQIGLLNGGPLAVAGWIVLPGVKNDILAVQEERQDQAAGIKLGATARPWSSQQFGSASTAELSWEYWNGSGWWALNPVNDGTDRFNHSGIVAFTVPDDLKPSDWAGKTSYWIRVRLVAGDYGSERIVAHNIEQEGKVTGQTVERFTDTIHPPAVAHLALRYRLCNKVLPAHVLSEDSASLRDQSDANRTAGAVVEAFVPLGIALARFDAEPAPAGTDTGCPPACDCGPVPQAGPPAPAQTPLPQNDAASGAALAGRALYFGFAANLQGEPINLLILVNTEREHDAFAPSRVDVLRGTHFEPVVASDATRAFGETGMLSFALSTAPAPAELFGQTLSWLRLRPHGGADEEGWRPDIAAAYLNAVWTQAAETQEFEMLGSSDGAPAQVVFLARPPVLRDTLELRVREPLGEEERASLLQADPASVRSDVAGQSGDWVLWRQVVDPADSAAADRVYGFDEASGEIRFGDALHGAIPPIGRDAIMAFQYRRTEAASVPGATAPANTVAAGSSLAIVTPVEGAQAAFAADHAAGGADAEEVPRILRFGPARLRHRERTVTARDLEDMALQMLPDLAQARCVPRGREVRLIVVMRGADPVPTRAVKRELRNALLAAGPPDLAARGAFSVTQAALRPFHVRVLLVSASLDYGGRLAQQAEAAITAFFDSAAGGSDGRGWRLGDMPLDTDVAACLLDLPHLDDIEEIALTETDAAGRVRPLRGSLRADELALLAADGIELRFEVREDVA